MYTCMHVCKSEVDVGRVPQLHTNLKKFFLREDLSLKVELINWVDENGLVDESGMGLFLPPQL